MKYNELTQEQKDQILEQEIEDLRNSTVYGEAIAFYIEFWLANSNEDFNVTEQGIEYA